jgi:hypothetical protein
MPMSGMKVIRAVVKRKAFLLSSLAAIHPGHPKAVTGTRRAAATAKRENIFMYPYRYINQYRSGHIPTTKYQKNSAAQNVDCFKLPPIALK